MDGPRTTLRRVSFERLDLLLRNARTSSCSSQRRDQAEGLSGASTIRKLTPVRLANSNSLRRKKFSWSRTVPNIYWCKYFIDA